MVEGDSVDETPGMLGAWAGHDERVKIVTHNAGLPRYASIANADRFLVMASVINAGIDVADLLWSDYVMTLPADIQIEPDLAKRLTAWNRDIIAPMVWMDGWFYDTWAFRYADGGRLGAERDRWEKEDKPQEPFEMGSVGGTNMISAAVLRAGCRYTKDAVDMGLCAWARELGFHVWADPTTHVIHDKRWWRWQ